MDLLTRSKRHLCPLKQATIDSSLFRIVSNFVKKNLLFCCLILGIVCFRAKGQDPGFSQFNALPTLHNPAFAGTTPAYSFSMLHRNQWPGLERAYRTQALAVSAPIQQWNCGWTFLAIHDDQASGTLKTTQIGLGYAYHLTISKQWHFSMGFRTDWMGTVLNPSQLRYGDQYDARQGLIYSSAETRTITQNHRLNWQTGGLAYSSRWAFGLSVDHLASNTTNNPTLAVLPKRKWTWHGSGRFPLFTNDPESWNIIPNVVWQQQGDFNFLNIGGYLENKVLTLGGWYRHNIGLVGLLGLQCKSFLVGYSYDYTFIPFAGSGGAHEISLRYKQPRSLKKQPKRRRIKRMPCPQF